MKKFEIEKKFTELVILYLAEGYIINSSSMSGHQGEEVKVDLIKNDELIRIWMNRECKWGDSHWYDYSLVIRVGRWNYPACHSAKFGSTVWMNDLQVFQEVKFYEISRDWYIENLEEASAIRELRSSRFRSRRISDQEVLSNEKAVEIAVKFLKRREQYQRVSRKDILVRKFYDPETKPRYYVQYRGNSYRVC